MQLLPRPSSKAISTTRDDRLDPTLPVILEYQSPSSAIINLPMPRIARSFTWTFSSMLAVMIVAAGVIKVDRVVTASGLVVSRAPTIVVQPLEAAILRSIEVHPGDVVHAGQILARLDPTFATADMGALVAQVSTLQAQVSRMQAEMENRPFTYTGLDPNMALQAAIYGQRQAEFNFKLENYQQKADSLSATIAKARSDVLSYSDRLAYAKSLEAMRKELEQLHVGSKINTLSAMDTRAQMQGALDAAQQQAMGAQRDLAALIAERNGYHPELACRDFGQTDRSAQQAVGRPGIAQQGPVAPSAGGTARRTGRNRDVGGQGFGRVGADCRPAVDHPGADRRPAGSRSQHLRQRRRPCACRRSRRYQVRHLPVHAVRPGPWRSSASSARTASPRRKNSATRQAPCRFRPTERASGTAPG